MSIANGYKNSGAVCHNFDIIIAMLKLWLHKSLQFPITCIHYDYSNTYICTKQYMFMEIATSIKTNWIITALMQNNITLEPAIKPEDCRASA